jgi:flagellar hook-associated protein 1 FlgK
MWFGPIPGKPANFEGGKLGALIELRDVDIRKEVQSLDTMTMNFVDLVNDIHKDGTGANGKTGVNFFTSQSFINNVAGNYDRNGDGQDDSSYIFRVTGANSLTARDQIGLRGNDDSFRGNRYCFGSLSLDRYGRGCRGTNQ